MRGAALAWLAVGLLAGCGKLEGLGGPAPPLATFQVRVDGDLGPLRPPGVTSDMSLQVALVWGAQWLTEPFCILPPESTNAAQVIAAGCRDPFGFVPNRVAANVPVTIGTTAELTLADLPGADVMVGDVTARVAYGSFVLYDDRDGDGTLDVATPHRLPRGGPGPEEDNSPDSPDIVYGASFVTMTAPDVRVAYREGGFDRQSAFYPRSGCGEPMPMFSMLAAGGFSAADGLASAAMGTLPQEDPSKCTETKPADTVVNIPLQGPADAHEVSCVEAANDSSVRYRRPPTNSPDLSGRMIACAHLPAFDAGGQSSLIQLVVSGRATDRCEGLTHYTLRGCRENVACAVPDWDFTMAPPSWWPCPQ